MYLGVDIGGTKTLVAVLDDSGSIVEQAKFPTPSNYEHWLLELRHTAHHFEHKDFQAAGVAVPGRIDRKHGKLIRLGNLPWKNEPIQADCERILNCPVVIENDANLAALSEAMLHKEYSTVLYFTISTGIGTGVVHDQSLDPALIDSEGGNILLPYKGRLTRWEKFASGKAIVEILGKKASDINDENEWKTITRNLALGFLENMVIVQPDLVIVGGSVGAHFPKYKDYLIAELKKYELPLLTLPPIVQAQRPEEAVVFGCYDLAKQRYPVGSVAQPA